MSGLVVALAGATGLVGGRLLERLLADAAVARVVAPTRRPLPPAARLENPRLEGAAWPALPALDEAYGCLGTTRAQAGSAEAFRAVDFDLALAFARACRAAGARSFGLVSSLGADAGSRFLYPRVKGEAEAAHAALGFPSLTLARPALLLGARERPRPAERAGELALAALSPLLRGRLAKYRPIPAAAVAAGLAAAVRAAAPGAAVVESDRLAAI